VGEAMKPRPQLSVSAHYLTRETKGLGCQIDRKKYTQCVAHQLSQRLFMSEALLSATAAEQFGVARCLLNYGQRTLLGFVKPPGRSQLLRMSLNSKI
jgi:hypothetical protein